MAAALVGGAFLSATLQVLFDRLASRQVLNFFKRPNLSDKLLKKLKMKMIAVNKVLNDAEAKQFTDSFVKEWTDELKDAVYEADDFLDEIAYEAMRLKVEAGSQTSTTTNQALEILSSCNPFVMEKAEMEAKLEEILERLDDLIQQKDALGLKEGIGEKTSAAVQKMPTTSLMDEHTIYGRESDKEALAKLVLTEDANGKQLDVIPIVGMGGVGKTTLAKLTYNDSRVQELFDLKAWVCVSEEFDVLKLTKEILKEVSPASSASCETMTPNQLHCELRNKTAEKKVLVVLDDVWSQNQEQWDSLLIPFMSVKQGSKIILTTRNDSVASVMSTLPTHHLQKLSEDDCWLVFARQAFEDGSSGAYPDLVEIGKEIVRRSNGLPLAAKALGGLLRLKRDVKEWERVLKSEMWNLQEDPILPALRVSYYYLPSQLKQCFAFCAMFPKDYQFDKDDLIRLWIAQGFIVPRREVEEVEEVGENYFHDLASRSFFQPYSSWSRLFVMHDLINELARSVSREFCVMLEGENSTEITVKARHLSYVATRSYDASQGIHGAELLRTLLPLPRWRTIDKAVRHFSPTLKRLRVLSLSFHESVAELFDTMGKLKHLRYLNLEGTSIKELPEVVGVAYNLQSLVLVNCRELVKLPDTIGSLKSLRYMTLEGCNKIKRLPESMCDLYNLQTLILRGCRNLRELPTGMGRLINLCHLDIQLTKLSEMPPGMGELTKLKKLSDFFIGKQSGSSIKELGKLQHLQESLCIRNLQNVVNAQDVAEADLKGKKQLELLEMRWNGDTDDSQHERNVLQKLEPNSNLKQLVIVGYGGTKFPDWVGLVQLTVGSSTSPKEIDVGHNPVSPWALQGPIWNLTCLSELSFVCCPNILNFPQGGLPAPNLKTLQLFHCRKLKWLPERMHILLPCIEKLEIVYCPEVESFPEGGLPSKLQSLHVRNCNKLIAGRMQWNLQSHPSLSEFTIGNNEEVESFLEDTLLPSTLTSLWISNLKNLKALNEGIQQLTSLKTLKIVDCPELQSMPRERLPSSLSSLEVNRCPVLETKCEKETGEYWSFISHIPSIRIHYKKIN